MSMKPTVGRIVYFFPPGTAGAPQPAMITAVHSETLVNLEVFGVRGDGPDRFPTSVQLFQPRQAGEDRPTSGYYAEWMPYQVGQAAKTDDLAKALGDRVAACEQLCGRIAEIQHGLANGQANVDVSLIEQVDMLKAAAFALAGDNVHRRNQVASCLGHPLEVDPDEAPIAPPAEEAASAAAGG